MTAEADNQYPNDLSKDRVYELVTRDVLQRMDKGASVEHDVQVPSVSDPSRTRQIDVLVTGNLGGFPLKIVVECKHYGRALHVGDLDGFLGKIEDVKCNLGVLVSLNGFGSGARSRAATEGNRVRLCQVYSTGNIEMSAPMTVTLVRYGFHGCNFRSVINPAPDWTGIGPAGASPADWQYLPTGGEVGSTKSLLSWALHQELDRLIDENPTFEVPGSQVKVLTTSGWLNPHSVKIEVQGSAKCEMRNIPLGIGNAVLNETGGILATNGLSSEWTKTDEGWAEVTPEEALALLRDRTREKPSD
jgi:hypothetical protein